MGAARTASANARRGCVLAASEAISRPSRKFSTQFTNTRHFRSHPGTASTWYPRCMSQARRPRTTIGPGVEVVVERNHHWSSRWFTDRNRALWSAFTIVTPGGNIFFAGDTGWGDGSWVAEAARRGPFRLAIIPIGAYEPRDFMRNHHVDPDEAVRIFEALNPVRALGVHWGTFQLTFEPIDDPRWRLAALLRQRSIAPDWFLATEAGQSFSVPVPDSAASPRRPIEALPARP